MTSLSSNSAAFRWNHVRIQQVRGETQETVGSGTFVSRKQ